MKIKNQLAIELQDYPVRMMQTEFGTYLCITDIAQISKSDNSTNAIKHYLRNPNNVEFLALWELHYNPNFKVEDFEHAKKLKTPLARQSLPPAIKWFKEINAIGLRTVAGRFGGTYAHQDIAIHFTISLNTEVYIHLTKELQRLKKAEQNLFNNPEKIPLEKIIAEANRMREGEKDKSEKTGEEKE